MENMLKDSISLPYVKAGVELPKDVNYTDEFLDEEILKPVKYITSLNDEKIWQTLIDVLTYCLDVPESKTKIISGILHSYRYGSLLVDDIQDKSVLRGGIPAAHTVFGVANTLMAADYLILDSFGKISALNHRKAVKIYTKACSKMIEGQGMELYWRENFICPSEEEYMEMVAKKTSTLFVLAGELMQLFSTSCKNPTKFLTTMGIYFQIDDDYQNLTNHAYFDSKGFCEDISEGKFGFPIVCAIKNHPEEAQTIKNILRDRTFNIERKKYCLSMIEQCGGFEYTRNKLKELKETALEELNKLGANPLVNDFIGKATKASLL